MSTQVREMLKAVLEEKGIMLKHIARQLNWNYTNMVSFKNGNLEYSEKRLKKLANYLNNL